MGPNVREREEIDALDLEGKVLEWHRKRDFKWEFLFGVPLITHHDVDATYARPSNITRRHVEDEKNDFETQHPRTMFRTECHNVTSPNNDVASM